MARTGSITINQFCKSAIAIASASGMAFIRRFNAIVSSSAQP